MSLDETLVTNDGTIDKSFVTIIRNGRSTTRRSTHASDPSTEPRTLTVSNQDVVSKLGKSSRSLVQVQKVKINSTDLKPYSATVNITLSIPAGNLFTDAEVAALLLQAAHVAGGSALTSASATTQVGRLRLGES